MLHDLQNGKHTSCHSARISVLASTKPSFVLLGSGTNLTVRQNWRLCHFCQFWQRSLKSIHPPLSCTELHFLRKICLVVRHVWRYYWISKEFCSSLKRDFILKKLRNIRIRVKLLIGDSKFLQRNGTQNIKNVIGITDIFIYKRNTENI